MNHFWYIFGDPKEIEFANQALRGKEAGLISRYSRFLDNVIQIRVVLFAIAIYSVVPMVFAYIDQIPNLKAFLIQQTIHFSLYLIAAIMYNTFRWIASLIVVIPVVANILLLLSVTGINILRPISIQFAILFVTIFGMYRHYQMKKIEKILTRA